MKSPLPLIAVSDMERSKAFYKKYLNLDVEVDFGANVMLTGGLALQTLETWRGFIDDIEVSFRGNAGELYFEEDDFDGFILKIDGLELVHPPKEHLWGGEQSAFTTLTVTLLKWEKIFQRSCDVLRIKA